MVAPPEATAPPATTTYGTPRRGRKRPLPLFCRLWRCSSSAVSLEKNKTPARMTNMRKVRPKRVLGAKSPNPSVEIVTKIKYTLPTRVAGGCVGSFRAMLWQILPLFTSKRDALLVERNVATLGGEEGVLQEREVAQKLQDEHCTAEAEHQGQKAHDEQPEAPFDVRGGVEAASLIKLRRGRRRLAAGGCGHPTGTSIAAPSRMPTARTRRGRRTK